MNLDDNPVVQRSPGVLHLAWVLLLTPLLALIGWWVVLCLTMGKVEFPSVSLALVSLAIPCLIALAIFLSARAVVFGFFRAFSLRVLRVLREAPDDEADEVIPFLLFNPGQELEIVTATLAAWKQEVASSSDRLSGAAGLWTLEPQARFQWAGQSKLYQIKSTELKKQKGYSSTRMLAVLAAFVSFPGDDLEVRKRFERVGDVFGSIAGVAEENGGIIGQVSERMILLVFSLGRDERTLAIRAVKAAREIQNSLAEDYPQASMYLVGDFFSATESMLNVSGGLRYHIDSPEISAIRAAAATIMTDSGLRFSSKLVSIIKAGGKVS